MGCLADLDDMLHRSCQERGREAWMPSGPWIHSWVLRREVQSGVTGGALLVVICPFTEPSSGVLCLIISSLVAQRHLTYLPTDTSEHRHREPRF